MQVLLLDDKEDLEWVDSSDKLADGAIEAGKWGDGPYNKYWLCRLWNGDDLLLGFIWYYQNLYECCASAPQDNPNQICGTTYDALVKK